MSTIDDSGLFHAEYDPAKAREYYLRTRKLKGRKKGIVEEPIKKSSAAKTVVKTTTPRKAKKTSEQKRKEAEAKVKALKGRLAKLKALLEKLVAEAKGRSGVEPKKDTPKANETAKEKATRNTDSKARKPLTAQQKAEARQRSKEHYEETKTAKKDGTASKEIEQVQAQIKAVRAQLKKAIADARKDSKGRASGKDSLADIDKVLDSVFANLGEK